MSPAELGSELSSSGIAKIEVIEKGLSASLVQLQLFAIEESR